ncbi:MAG: ferric reductase-like transmembrane domain-containing protein [Pseudomonadota bacterium]
MRLVRAALIWGGLVLALAVPITAAALSPLLAWRDPIYILAGFAGIVALALLLMQPLLATGALPGLPMRRSRQVHTWVGIGLLVAVIVHVAGLWVTSPPDVVDALLFVSPTPFSVWGVLAMWAVFAAGTLAALRARLRIRPKLWRGLHLSLAVVVVLGTIVHAVLIEGAMEPFTKLALCGLVVVAMLKPAHDIWRRGKNRRKGQTAD